MKRGLLGDEHVRHPAAAELSLDGVGGAQRRLESRLEVVFTGANVRRRRARRPSSIGPHSGGLPRQAT